MVSASPCLSLPGLWHSGWESEQAKLHLPVSKLNGHESSHPPIRVAPKHLGFTRAEAWGSWWGCRGPSCKERQLAGMAFQLNNTQATPTQADGSAHAWLAGAADGAAIEVDGDELQELEEMWCAREAAAGMPPVTGEMHFQGYQRA